MPGIPCPPCTRSHGSGGAPAHLGSGLAHGSMQSHAGGGGGGGGSALAVSATIRPSPESRANTAATMRVLMVPPRSRFRPARCHSRPGSSRGRTRQSWRRCRRRVWRWQTREWRFEGHSCFLLTCGVRQRAATLFGVRRMSYADQSAAGPVMRRIMAIVGSFVDVCLALQHPAAVWRPHPSHISGDSVPPVLNHPSL
jgi:hypothetical protein